MKIFVILYFFVFKTTTIVYNICIRIWSHSATKNKGGIIMRKKKLFVIAAAAALATTLGCATAYAGTIPKINLNGNKILLQDSPFIENGTTYIPLRALADNMGISVDWDSATNTATLKSGATTITQTIGSKTATVNGQPVNLPAEALIRDGVTYIPVRFAAEALGGEITYNTDANSVNITYTMPKGDGRQYDPFGRLIRTTDLPANAGEFEHIISGVPNDMYEMPLKYDRGEWLITPVEGKDFIRPKDLRRTDKWATDDNILRWKKVIEKNLDLRLNFDYRTIGDEWKTQLMDTLFSKFGQDYYVDGYGKELSEYISYAKENHLIIDGDYYVEPSITYLEAGEYMRAWIRFKINSDVIGEALPYQKYMDISENFETNIWYEGYLDFPIGTNNMGSDGSDLVVVNNCISEGTSNTIQKAN